MRLFAGLDKHNVLRLDVAVDDAFRVKLVHLLNERLHQVYNLFGIHSAPALLHRSRQSNALHKVHDNVRCIMRLKIVSDVDDIRTVEARQRPCF